MIKDGVYEFMNIRGFCHWMSKPKNNCMPAPDADRKFWTLHADVNTRTDEDPDPPAKDLVKRIAVKVKTLLIEREIDSPKKN